MPDIGIETYGCGGRTRQVLGDVCLEVNGCQTVYHCALGDDHRADAPSVDTGSLDALVEQLTDGGHVKVIVTDLPFDDNWFAHHRRRAAVLTTADWDDYYAPPPLKTYLKYILAQSLLLSAADLDEDAVLDRHPHLHQTHACCFDLCAWKTDIRFGLQSGALCHECRSLLQQMGARRDAMEAADQILDQVRYEALARAHAYEPRSAFVVMPFTTAGDDNEECYKCAIAPALEDVGLRPVRYDEQRRPGRIYDGVLDCIARCGVVVAKVNPLDREQSVRPNVALEAGLAYGMRKPTFLICRTDKMDKFKKRCSDLSNEHLVGYRVGAYGELRAELVQWLRHYAG
ncbi:nucleotide-binding protein [bacterium]|nr:nucleotide-binding protein [bacterium]